MRKQTDFIIDKIEWHNMFLLLTVLSDAEGAYFRFAPKAGPGVSYDIPECDAERTDSGYTIRLNISAAAGRGFLPDGEWVIKASCREGAADEAVRVSYKTAYSFSSLSRVFRYAEGKAYILTFDVDPDLSDQEAAGFFLTSSFMKTDAKWRDKSSGIRNVVYRTLRSLSRNEHAPGKNHVLFMSETKDHITGNLKAVYDRMIERGMDSGFRISIYARNDVGRGLGVKGLIRLRKLISDQDYIFVDDFAPVFTYLDPPEGARLIQLWHAAVGFKSVGYSRFGKEGSPHPEWSCHRKYTDVFVPHENLIDVYREVFGVEKDAFRVAGSPRLDGFADPETVKEVKEALAADYPALKDKKVILFAPTFRGSGEKEAHYDEQMLDLGRIYDFLGNDAVFLIKMHPFVTDRISIPEEYSDRILDMSGYPDINELYYASDILITDYSSDYFEFSLLRKPILFYTYDRDLYQLCHGVHQDIAENAPGKVCDTFDELMEALESGSFDLEKTERFADVYDRILKTSAADEVIDRIFKEERQGD